MAHTRFRKITFYVVVSDSTMYKFGNPPIVIVTDRKQLDEQIHTTFRECGFPEPEKARVQTP